MSSSSLKSVSSASYKPTVSLKNCKQCLILSEQSQHRIAIADVSSQKIVWEWKAETSNVKPQHTKWFTNISDAKLVYDGKYIIACASGGGVALIRIADGKTVFYAYAGGNTHSVEVLPDGNLVSASSTGNYLTVFHVDSLTGPEQVYRKNIPVAFGHNVVWDHKRQLLWSAAMNELIAYRYNFNCSQPDLQLAEVIRLPGTEAHDLFPVYGTDSLWITNPTDVYQFDAKTKKVKRVDMPYKHVKSISSGPAGFPVAISYPKQQWWTNEIFDINGERIFQQDDLKIYKARWLVNNPFSYKNSEGLKMCQ
jgi:hypothetical protein